MDAAKKKSLSPAGLTALRVLLLLVVGLCLGQTRVWGLDAAPHHASGQIAVASASAVGEIAPAVAYDVSECPVAADTAVNTAGGTATQLEFNFANEFGQNSGLVIGRGADLAAPGTLGPGEYKLGWFSVQGTSGMDAEWSVNQMKLQNVMNLNLPIRDASSLLDTGGFYLNQERGLLQSAGWTYQGGSWLPPVP